jgi:hypothetical protein
MAMNDPQIPFQKSYFALTPPEREAIASRAVQKAIARMHKKGIPTVEVDEMGNCYWHYPDGKRVPIEKE